MFEKEAEEYADKNKTRGGSSSFGDITNYHDLREGFIAGAEFGYNKANEWHYPSKGEYPKETGLLMSKTLLLLTKMKGSDCLSLTLGQYNFSTQEFSYQHIVGLTDVIAWKEIVLPKESE